MAAHGSQFRGLFHRCLGQRARKYYATANGGIGYHYNGSSWSQIKFPFAMTGNLHSVWGSDASHVWMVGDAGQILFFNGSFWAKVTSPTTQPLLTVWGTSATNVFAAGGSGTMLHFNGSTWSAQPSGTVHTLSGFGGTGPSNVWVVGASGVTQHYNGSTWSTVARKSGFLITSISSGARRLDALGGRRGRFVPLGRERAILTLQPERPSDPRGLREQRNQCLGRHDRYDPALQWHHVVQCLRRR